MSASFAFDFPEIARGEDPAIVVMQRIVDREGNPYDFGDDEFELLIGAKRVNGLVREVLVTLTRSDGEIVWETVEIDGQEGTQFTFTLSGAKLDLLPNIGEFVGDLFRISDTARTRFAKITSPLEGGISA